MPAALKYSFPATAYRPDVRANHRALDALLNELGLDVLVVSSHDQFLTAYTPCENSLRYALSGFDGSVGSGVFVRQDRLAGLDCTSQFILFVDGRYHIQADRQTERDLVQVEKLPLGTGIWDGIANWLAARAGAIGRIGWDPYRVGLAQRARIDAALDGRDIAWIALEGQECERAVALPGWQVERPIFALPESVTGRSVTDNLARLRAAMAAKHGEVAACYLACAGDDIGYLLNSRGYHLPTLSSHLSYAFVVADQVALYLPHASSACPVDLDVPNLHVFREGRDGRRALLEFLSRFDVRQVCYRAESANCILPQWARAAWPQAKHDDAFQGLDTMRARKTEAEQAAVRTAFARSSRAVAQAMRFAKYGRPGVPGERHTEHDLAVEIVTAYREQGAVGLSFEPISATGETAALMHYKESSKTRELREGDLVLLDSGAYYAEGFATDCTRTVLRNASGQARPAPWQQEIYTTVLKAGIAGMRATWRAGTTGAEVDRLVRDIVRERGFDYACGTGHGIGIHVHEGGINFSPASPFVLQAGMAVSVEPGIYLDGQGGVRIENVILTHADASGDIRFENIIHVGYDWELIDLARLDDDEQAYLRDYERACRKLGTHVTPCPLLD